jgi:hypothetical protein
MAIGRDHQVLVGVARARRPFPSRMTGRFGAPQILFINEIGFLRHCQVLVKSCPGILPRVSIGYFRPAFL